MFNIARVVTMTSARHGFLPGVNNTDEEWTTDDNDIGKD
jgi:hypothetical protein